MLTQAQDGFGHEPPSQRDGKGHGENLSYELFSTWSKSLIKLEALAASDE